MLEAAKIALFATLAAVVYGILHDQVTAHLCVEYFTIAHPPVFNTTSPFLLALGWGVIATWWVGLPLGVVLALVARVGSARKLALSDVRPAILRLMAISAVAALLSGGIGYALVATARISLSPFWFEAIPSAKHAAFNAAAWGHLASYVVGALGGLFVVGWAILRRLSRRPYPA